MRPAYELQMEPQVYYDILIIHVVSRVLG